MSWGSFMSSNTDGKRRFDPLFTAPTEKKHCTHIWLDIVNIYKALIRSPRKEYKSVHIHSNKMFFRANPFTRYVEFSDIENDLRSLIGTYLNTAIIHFHTMIILIITINAYVSSFTPNACCIRCCCVLAYFSWIVFWTRFCEKNKVISIGVIK